MARNSWNQKLSSFSQIVSGTSAGSVIGSLVCTRTDKELEELIKPEILVQRMKCFETPWKERLKNVRKHGYMFEFEDWFSKIQW